MRDIKNPAKSRPLSANVRRLMKMARESPENQNVVKIAREFTQRDVAYCDMQGNIFMAALDKDMIVAPTATWTVLPVPGHPEQEPTEKLVTLTTLLLLLPVVGWAFEITNPDVPYWRLMGLAILSGIGGGAFSGFMPSTSYFFPRRLQGTALGLQAGIGNFGVSLVQLLTPWLISFPLFGFAFLDRVSSDFLAKFGFGL